MLIGRECQLKLAELHPVPDGKIDLRPNFLSFWAIGQIDTPTAVVRLREDRLDEHISAETCMLPGGNIWTENGNPFSMAVRTASGQTRCLNGMDT